MLGHGRGRSWEILTYLGNFDSLGTSSFAYDAWGRLTGTTRFDNVSASVAMNIMGYVNSTSDVMARPTTLYRDNIGRVNHVLNARGDHEYYTFDNDGLMTAIQNGNAKTRNYYYTQRGELREIDFADGTTEQYKFDGNGNQTRRINGMFQTINYVYDDAGNLTLVDYPTGTDTSFSYDNDGRQTSMVDSTGTSSWQYDNADNVLQLTTPQGVMNYTYDVWNRRTKLTEGTVETTYGFSQGRLTSINKSADGVATTLHYDAYGRLEYKDDGATRTLFGYDDHDRLLTLDHVKTSTNTYLHSETYNYFADGSLQNKLVNSVLTSYTYDEINQLKSESGGGINNTYNYDHNGNRISRISNAGTDTYTYDDADKVQSVSRTYAASSTYGYDDCGRTTSITGYGAKTFSWDYEDRLTSVTPSGVSATSYGYNGVGARTSKSGPNGSRTYKRNGVGATSSVLSDGVSTMVPGTSEKSGSTTSFIHADRLGSMKALSNGGTVTDTALYDAFGKATTRTGTNTTQKGFAGQLGYQEDGESGYKLLGHRYYDADTGRFISRDPAFDGHNWYAYCRNNPLNKVDPAGLGIVEVVFNGGRVVYHVAEDAVEAMAHAVGLREGGTIVRHADTNGPSHMHNVVYPPNARRYPTDEVTKIHVTSAQEADHYANSNGRNAGDWHNWRDKAVALDEAVPELELERDVLLQVVLEDAGLGPIGDILAIIPLAAMAIKWVGDEYITPATRRANRGLNRMGRTRWLDEEDGALL